MTKYKFQKTIASSENYVWLMIFEGPSAFVSGEMNDECKKDTMDSKWIHLW